MPLPGSVSRDSGPVQRLPTQRPTSYARPSLSPVRLRTHGRVAHVLDGERFHHLHCVGWRARLHATVSQDMYGIPRERVVAQQQPRLHQRRRWRHDQAHATPGLPGRRAGEASAHMEPHRPSSAGRGRQLQWRRTDAGGHQYADKPTLRLLILHDDAEREFDYASGAEDALKRAEADAWTVVSMKNDWSTVF